MFDFRSLFLPVLFFVSASAATAQGPSVPAPVVEDLPEDEAGFGGGDSDGSSAGNFQNDCRPAHIRELVPNRVTNDRAYTVTVRGANLDLVAAVELQGVETTVLTWVTIDPHRIDVTVPAGVTGGVHNLVLRHQCLSKYGAAAVFFVDDPLPRVTSLSALQTPRDVALDVTIGGANLDSIQSLFFEGDQDQVVEIDFDLSGSEVIAHVPADLDEGDYLVRVINQGGISVQTLSFTVAPPLQPLPVVENIFGLLGGVNDEPHTITLLGKNFTGATSVVASGDTDVSVAFTLSNDSTLHATLPQGTAPDVYQFLVTTPNGTNSASQISYTLFDPAAEQLDTDGLFWRVNTDTVAVLTPTFRAALRKGRLVFFYNVLTGRPILCSDSDGNMPLGLEWSSPSPGAFVDNDYTTFDGVTTSTTANGVEFAFRYETIDAFRVIWTTDPTGSELQVSFDYDVPVRILRAYFGSFTAVDGVRQLAAAFGGLALDWSSLERTFYLLYPDFYNSAVVFFEDTAGGGLFVDMSTLENSSAGQTIHKRTGTGGATRMRFWATPQKDILKVGTLGPVRFVPTAGNWADGAEPYQDGLVNPHKTPWLDDITSVFRILSLSDPHLDPQLVRDVYDGIEPDEPLPSGWQMLHAHNASNEGPTGVPDWTPKDIFTSFCEPLQQEGWRVVPYVITPGLQDEHGRFAEWQPFLRETWDKDNQENEPRFWDGDRDGMCCDHPEDYWIINLSHAPYRDYVKGQVAAGRLDSFAFDGVYFDLVKSIVGLNDRNFATGDSITGYGDLVEEFTAAFGGDDFLISSEGSSVQLLEAGTSMATIHIIPPGLLETDLTAGNARLHLQHPIGSYLVSRESRLMSTSDFGMPGARQAQFYMGRLLDMIQGAVPTGVGFGASAWQPISFGEESKRALVQVAEEGLYWRNHGVRPSSDPSPLWSDPETLRVYEIDGETVARTKDWFVKKTLCDLSWHFGGRAPTASELADLASRTSCNLAGIYAAMCEVRAFFQANPTPPAEIQSRADARADILAVFPEYPAP